MKPWSSLSSGGATTHQGGWFSPFLKQQGVLGDPLSARRCGLLPAMIYILVLSRSMKKTPPIEAPAEPKEDPVPEKPVQVLKPPKERAGTLGCSLTPSVILMVLIHGPSW